MSDTPATGGVAILFTYERMDGNPQCHAISLPVFHPHKLKTTETSNT